MDEGRNQATVAALLGVEKSIVSRDAGWTKLPQSVRDQVGRDGFTHTHAIELIPHVARLTGDKTASILHAYRQKPCNVRGFRKIVAANLKDGRKKWPKALKIDGNKLTMDLNELDAAGLTPGQLRQALEVLRKATRTLEAVVPS
jgi:hypothetical protein